MSNSHFLKSKAILHSYSHSPYIEGQEFTNQAGAKAGHHINNSDIRGEEIPKISTINERNNFYLFQPDGEPGHQVGGELGVGVSSVIKFLDKYNSTLREIPNTNGEAFEIVDISGNLYQNFICPTDAQISSTIPSLGYEFLLYSEDGTEISKNYGWDFDYFNGILHFNPNFKPSSENWNFGALSNLSIEAFIYIGKTAEARLKACETNDISIQPIRFNSIDMIKDISTFENKNGQSYVKCSINILGFVFHLTSTDLNESIIGDMNHITNEGTTTISFNFPCDDSGNLLNVYTFLAWTFVKTDGSPIQVNPIINYNNANYYTEISPEENTSNQLLNNILNINIY